MDFYGTVDKIDEKKDGKSSKKLSETYRQRNPEKPPASDLPITI